MESTKYEITYIIRPDLSENDKKTVVERFDKIFSENGATVVESKDWSKRRLAYEINKFREGIYHIINIEATDDKAINEFDRLSKISNEILRSMIVKRED